MTSLDAGDIMHDIMHDIMRDIIRDVANAAMCRDFLRVSAHFPP